MLLERRRSGQATPEEAGRPPALASLLRGHEALAAERTEEAVAAFREAATQPAVQPFARYALACLGQDDPAAVLASQPGLFLALRCRAWIALDRFRKRQATPAELLDAVQQAASAGWTHPAADHFRRLAQSLSLRHPTADDLRSLSAERPTDPAARRNLLRAAVEIAVRRLPPAAALERLLEWSGWEDWTDDLRSLLSRQLLRLLLLRRGEGPDVAVLAAVDRLAPGDGLAALVRTWLSPDTATPLPAGPDAPPAVRLWQAARVLADGGPIDEAWRAEVRGLRSLGRLKGAAQALLLLEAARSSDAAAVAALLDETDAWRGFRAAPPPSVTDAVAAVVAQPSHPGWRRGLARWVQVWGAAALGPKGATLAAQAGLPTDGAPADPPTGTAPVPWFLHQAARRWAATTPQRWPTFVAPSRPIPTWRQFPMPKRCEPRCRSWSAVPAPAPWPMPPGRTTPCRRRLPCC